MPVDAKLTLLDLLRLEQSNIFLVKLRKLWRRHENRSHPTMAVLLASVIETFHLIDDWATLDNVVNDDVLSAFARHFKVHLRSYFAGIHKKKIRFVSSH